MERCPRCENKLDRQFVFCPHCGAQLETQKVEGEVLEFPGNSRQKRRLIDPGRAARLSLIPGLGHWYAGAPLRGLAFFAAILAPIVIGTELDLTVVGAILGIPLDVGALALWVYCAFDAYRTARKRIESVN
jgi:hypothetical protein